MEAVLLVESTKRKLQEFRESGFNPLLKKIHLFCGKNNIQILNMEEEYINEKGHRSKRQRHDFTNQHYYNFDCFNVVVDWFSDINTELLQNMTTFISYDSFSKFDELKLTRLCEFYPYDFDSREKITLSHQLGLYIDNVQKDERYANLNCIADLSRVMVETRKHISFPLVYRLLKLTLVLLVATATVERCFSVVKNVKTKLRNRIGQDFLNACVVCSIEKEAFESVTNEDVINRFQKMKFRRGQL
ncbi:uncharacterized protein LOC143538106 [Bidens hawaiensis]|uniref:uncharacterized protein LOC143538106 n=1 Tax=Bidens hawaiensis TaxID=980011 RepID=UPI0040493AAB